jgi:hypothetical protein
MKLKANNLNTFWTRTKQSAKNHPRLFTLYLVLRLLVVVVMIAEFLNGNYANVFMCILTLVLFLIPSFVEKRIKVDVPDTLEVIILLFIFAADILGEINSYYINFPGWDTMLHTINGFLCAAIGIALIDILNRHEKFCISMSPLFVALVAFCFSMTIGVLWEFFEFAGDIFLRTDMQKDTILSSVSTIQLHPEGMNIPVIVDHITKTVINADVNGQASVLQVNGYLDIGLMDTMKDLLVNLIGAIVFSVIGYFHIKYRGEGKNSKFVGRFIMTKIQSSDMEEDRSSVVLCAKDDKKSDSDES